MKLHYWKKRRPKHCCLNCQFLSRTKTREVNRMFTQSWIQEERNNECITEIPGYPQYAHCSERIWTTEDPEHPTVDLNIDLERELGKNRDEECYFIKYVEGRSYNVSKELQPVQFENRKNNKEHRTKNVRWLIGIIVAIGVTLANTLF